MSNLFRPPVNRSMRTLDRNFFRKTVHLTAARIFENNYIGHVRRECGNDILKIRGIDSMAHDPQHQGRKVLLLKPHIKHDDLSTAGGTTRELINSKFMELIPYELEMKYENWNYDEIIQSILPDELLNEVPGSFAQAGHIAHLNLRNVYLPYKEIIAQIILDKNTQVKTVVNKIEDVGAVSVFRTFPMEILQGPANTVVEVRESGCNFRFDFAKVYWNSRLAHEHERIISKFRPGEAVSDVMAGVGPFSLPAAKKGCLVWANDLNPDSFAALTDNIKRNKVTGFVTAHNQDGRDFIRDSIRNLYKMHCSPASNPISIPSTLSRRHNNSKTTSKAPCQYVVIPPTFSHFVMNLPGSAVEFLDAFIGSYRGLEHVFEDGKTQLPMVHVHTFHRELPGKGDWDASMDVCAQVSKNLNFEMTLEDVEIVNIRRVAPHKVMYCASFRLPIDVAFGSTEPVKKSHKLAIDKMWKIY